MTTFQRSIILLSSLPTDQLAAEMAAESCESNFDSTECTWRLSATLPEDVPIDSADQLSAYKRDLGPQAIYLVIEKD